MDFKLEHVLGKEQVGKDDVVQELWIVTCRAWIASSNDGKTGGEVLFPARAQPKRCWPVMHRLAMKAAFGPDWFADYQGGQSLHLPSAIFERWKESPACTQQLILNLQSVLQSPNLLTMSDWVRAAICAYEFRLADLHAQMVEKLVQLEAPLAVQAVVHLGSPF